MAQPRFLHREARIEALSAIADALYEDFFVNVDPKKRRDRVSVAAQFRGYMDGIKDQLLNAPAKGKPGAPSRKLREGMGNLEETENEVAGKFGPTN